MNPVKVKICGITNSEDASTAVQHGADALGFIFANSPRQIAPQKARDIIHTLPPFVKTVGVFVNEGSAEIKKIQHYCGLDLIQLHGDEPPGLCHELMPATIKALRIKDASSIQSSLVYQGNVKALLLDTYAKDKAGGTGTTFDWQLAVKIKALGIPIILAGGLGPSNIEDAVRTVRPYGVDINSGVEQCPGRKSHKLMKDLMRKLRRMN